jgi:ribonuclease P protein component
VVHVVIHSPVDSAAVDSEPVRAQPARAGFVVSRAVGNAVVRNKVKRRLRQLVRERLAELPSGTDVVVRALPESATRTYAELGTDLDAALAAARRPRSPRGSRHTSAQERTS